MKKFLYFLMLVILSGQHTTAADLCPTAYELSSGWARFASRASGSNFIHKTILEKYLETQVSKKFPGKFNIKIDSFSTADLKEGKFKGLHATGENVILDELSVSKVSLNSICNFNQIEKTENSTYRFVTDFPANVTLELSADNLNKITKTTDYKRIIKEINQNLLGFLRIDEIKFDIKENKLWYNFIFSTPFSPKKQSVTIGTNISLTAEGINIENAETNGKPTILSILNMTDALNYVNPLDFSAKILENSIINADIKEVSIKENKIILNAFVNIRK